MVEQVLGLKPVQALKQPRGVVSGRLADQVLQLTPERMMATPVARAMTVFMTAPRIRRAD